MFSDLTRRNWAAGVVCKDSGDDGLNPGTAAAAPGEIETRAFDEELVLAGGNSGVSGGLRIGDGGDGGGVPGTVIGGLLDSEQESNEEEGGEEMKEEEETLSAIPSPSPSSVSAAKNKKGGRQVLTGEGRGAGSQAVGEGGGEAVLVRPQAVGEGWRGNRGGESRPVVGCVGEAEKQSEGEGEAVGEGRRRSRGGESRPIVVSSMMAGGRRLRRRGPRGRDTEKQNEGGGQTT
nr:hypothetical protein Iba_chr09aCG11450 [Ipomoea batatas]